MANKRAADRELTKDNFEDAYNENPDSVRRELSPFLPSFINYTIVLQLCRDPVSHWLIVRRALFDWPLKTRSKVAGTPCPFAIVVDCVASPILFRNASLW